MAVRGEKGQHQPSWPAFSFAALSVVVHCFLRPFFLLKLHVPCKAQPSQLTTESYRNIKPPLYYYNQVDTVANVFQREFRPAAALTFCTMQQM